MTKVAVLGSPVRLIVLKFLMRSDLVPVVIPRLPINSSGILPSVPGKNVLPSTPRTYLSNFVADLFKRQSEYKLVGARVACERSDGKSDVRFTFCHEQYIDRSKAVHPNFSSNYNQLARELFAMVSSNLWLTQADLNPYFEASLPVHQANVLFLSSTGRTPLFDNGKPIYVYKNGRDKRNGQGLGPKIPLVRIAKKLEIVRSSDKSKEVRLI